MMIKLNEGVTLYNYDNSDKLIIHLLNNFLKQR